MTTTLVIDNIPNDEFINILAPENNPGFSPGGLYLAQSLLSDCIVIEQEAQPLPTASGIVYKKFFKVPTYIGIGLWVMATGTKKGLIAFDVDEKKKTTPAITIDANRVTAETTLAVAASIGDTTITVASATSINDGDYIGMFSLITNRFYTGNLIAAPSGAILSLDSPLDSAFAIGDVVGAGSTNMVVDGSSTPVVFGLRGADPGIQVTADIHRMMISCVASTAVDLTKFGDIAALTKGILIRRSDGTIQNLINWKTNISMKQTMFDWEALSDTNPGVGLNGFSGRFTFEKLGSVIRVGPGEDLQVVIQDSITAGATMVSLGIKFQGNIV